MFCQVNNRDQGLGIWYLVLGKFLNIVIASPRGTKQSKYVSVLIFICIMLISNEMQL